MCAAGLPGAQDLDFARLLAWLDDAARQVDLQTRARLASFIENPAAFDHSLGRFCCHYLLRTLQELLGVRYNPARAADEKFQDPESPDADFSDASDLFIHGMMGGPGGTCASMPVLYVAVGRRLGYPLKLVEAPGHVFCRWDDPAGRSFNVPEVFNVEGTGYGISFHPDEHYRNGRRKWRPIDEASGWYLKSLSPAEELAAFLGTRGSCLGDNGRIEEALQAFAWAIKLVPGDLRYHSEFTKLLKQSYEGGLKALEVQRQALEAERRMLDQDRLRLEQRVHQLENASAYVARDSSMSHGDTCTCLPCRQARQSMQRSPMPGHPAGCGCPGCRNSRQSPFGPW